MGKKSKRRVIRTERVYQSAPAAVMPEPVTFKLDGNVYTCRELNALELSDIARMDGLDAKSARSIGFMAELFETLLGRAQYLEFRGRCGQFQTNPEVFVKIIEGVFEDFSDRAYPTAPSSDSSPGSATIAQSSTDDSSSARVLESLAARPDLQQAVVNAERARREGSA